MRVLCFHHKGGVGKTTTAIHLTGVLLSWGDRVLLIDGDSQADSFRFFSDGIDPQPWGERLTTEDGLLTVVSERDAKKPIGLPASLVKLANESKFQHVVVDIATDLPNIGSILVEIEPDLVFLGVRRYDIGSFVHLNDMLIAIRTAMPLITSSVDIKILPIGVEKSEFQEYFNPSILPCHILEPLDWMPIEAGRAIFVDYTYLWSRDGCEGFWDYYRSILGQ